MAMHEKNRHKLDFMLIKWYNRDRYFYVKNKFPVWKLMRGDKT